MVYGKLGWAKMIKQRLYVLKRRVHSALKAFQVHRSTGATDRHSLSAGIVKATRSDLIPVSESRVVPPAQRSDDHWLSSVQTCSWEYALRCWSEVALAPGRRLDNVEACCWPELRTTRRKYPKAVLHCCYSPRSADCSSMKPIRPSCSWLLCHSARSLLVGRLDWWPDSGWCCQ